MIRNTSVVDQNGLVLLKPDWPAPDWIKACCTTRQGGVSQAGYAQLNLAAHVNDAPAHVAQNRKLLCDALQLQQQPVWLRQIHSSRVLAVPPDDTDSLEADASYTTQHHQVCAVMTADCLPLLLTNKQGSWVAAVHAGWRGLAANIISKTIACYPAHREELLIWLGPAISGQAYEVDDAVRDTFLNQSSAYEGAFEATRSGHYLFNVYEAARIECQQAGIGPDQIYGGGACTFSQAELFYSYRRDGADTGRMASLIWIEQN